MGLFHKFTDTVFLKENSDLQDRYDVLSKLIELYPNNDDLLEEYYCVKKGLEGEKEIHYQLEKANIGMYVLHDVNYEYDNLTAQVDYIVVTKLYAYFIECKNLIGNITVNEKGDFIREFTFNNKKIRKGMYSPLRQAEEHRDVFKKIWNNNLSNNSILNTIRRYFAENNFTKYHRVLVVAANNETILNTKYAPSDIKYKIVKADALVRQIKYDLDHSNKGEWSSDNEQEKWAKGFLKFNVEKNIDYNKYYREKYNLPEIDLNKLREDLIEFRKTRSSVMNIPAYYVFTNEELDKIIDFLPRTLEELTSLKILPPIKVKTHGKEIIDLINRR